MTVEVARPDVADLTFQMYERSVHPELFQVTAELRIERENYTAEFRLWEAGHVISFRHGRECLTEVIATRQQMLPLHRRRVERRIQGCQHESQRFEDVRYDASFQLERLESNVYERCHDELAHDLRTADLACAFATNPRFGPLPMSLMRIDATQDSLLVHAFHTFPDSLAVVKTQSLYELDHV
ncbi:DUF2617 family protein [Thalassoroseus pseudoceratinae]|uniref:DUF2617 family protein n=1 Tax=Thalassoroseus pseudoceratinae TaxID=2713176 RepID=UPI0014206F9F|nr:DUF2617 family protein [Thalassoroseus pseudoceratinae]